MKITFKFLEEHNVCQKGIDWFIDHKFRNIRHDRLIKKLMTEDIFNWANWLISKLLSKDNCVKYSIYAVNAIVPEVAAFIANAIAAEAAYAVAAYAYAAEAAKVDAAMKKKIINYGLKLLEEQNL